VAMPQRLVVARPRSFHVNPCCKAASTTMHGHWVEFIVETAYVVVAASQLAVIGGFRSTASHDYFETACWVFAMTSFVVAAVGLHTYHEIWQQYSADVDEEHAIAGRGLFYREMCGNTIFVIAQICFGVGCILFLPDLGGSVYRHATSGTYFFCAGSCGFVVAVFFNLIDMREPPKDYPELATKLNMYSLGLSQVASAAFGAGSFLYFPEFANGQCTVPPEWNPVDVGTLMYTLGCALFVVSSLLSWYQTLYMMNRTQRAPSEHVMSTFSNSICSDDASQPVADGSDRPCYNSVGVQYNVAENTGKDSNSDTAKNEIR